MYIPTAPTCAKISARRSESGYKVSAIYLHAECKREISRLCVTGPQSTELSTCIHAGSEFGIHSQAGVCVCVFFFFEGGKAAAAF